MAKAGSPRTPKRVTRLERQRVAVELRQRGLTYDQIAVAIRRESEKRDAEGKPRLITSKTYTRSTAYRDIRDAILAASKALALDAESLREIEVGRAEAAYRLAWSFAEDRNPKDGATLGLPVDTRLSAVDRALRASERLAMLQGLDAPKRVDAKLDIAREAERLARETGVPAREIIAEAERLTGGAS